MRDPVAIAARRALADGDACAADAAVRVAVDDRHLHGSRPVAEPRCRAGGRWIVGAGFVAVVVGGGAAS